MKRFLLHCVAGTFLGSISIAFIILARAFIYWDWWPDTHATIFGPSDAENFLCLLRLVFAASFLGGTAIPLNEDA